MEANAYGMAALEDKDLENIKDGNKVPGNAAIISPGTGLGEGGLYWDGSHYHPFATEGGHCDFSPRNEADLEIWEYFKQKYEHVSWERIISGSGIYDISVLLRRVSGINEPQWLRDMLAKEDPAAVITSTAQKEKILFAKKP